MEATKLHRSTETTDDLDVKRDDIITIRLSAEERAAWQAAANYDQRKLADWIRVVCNAHLRRLSDAQLDHISRGVAPGAKPGRSKKGGK